MPKNVKKRIYVETRSKVMQPNLVAAVAYNYRKVVKGVTIVFRVLLKQRKVNRTSNNGIYIFTAASLYLGIGGKNIPEGQHSNASREL